MNLLISPPPLFYFRFAIGMMLLGSCICVYSQHTSPLASVWNSSLAPVVKIDSLTRMLQAQPNGDSLEKYASQTILLSQEVQTPKQQAILLNRLGKLAEQDQRHLTLAETYYRQALTLRKQTGNTTWTAFLATKLGDMTSKQGRHLASIEMYREAIGLYTLKDDLKNLSISTFHQGINFHKLYMLDSAHYYFLKALDLRRTRGDAEEMISVYHELGFIYHDREAFEMAQNYRDSAALLLAKNQLTETALMADNYQLQAGILRKNKHFEEAIHQTRQSINIYQKLGEEESIAISMNNIGNTYIQMGEYDQAILALKAATDLVSDSLSSDLLATIYRNLSDAHRYSRKYELALAYSQKSQEAFLRFRESSKGKGGFIAKLEQQFLAEHNNTLAESRALYVLNRRQRRQFFLALTAAFLIIVLSLWGFWQAKNNHRKTKEVLSLNQELHNQKILHLVKDREDELATAFIEGQDKEREQIAAELHDNLAGSIAASKNLVGLLPSADTLNPSHPLHNKVIQILDSVYQHTRLLSHQLTHSIQQYSFGDLSRELEDLLENLRMLHIDVNLQTRGDTKENIDSLTAFHLKRIVQEAITNIIKYAQASSVQVYLDWQSKHVNMTLEDDGIGFDPSYTEEGIGIQNMTMRVKRLHGDIQIYSSPKNGTRTELSIPKDMQKFAYH